MKHLAKKACRPALSVWRWIHLVIEKLFVES